MNSKVLKALMIPDNMYIHNKKISLYHVSPNGSLKELTPRYSMKPIKGEDNSIKRISATPTIDGCFRGVGYNLNPGDKPIKFYIYKLLLSDSTKIIKPTTKMVPDRDLCDEYWVLNPVKVKSLGYITISLDPKTNKYQFDDSKVTENLNYYYNNKLIPIQEGFFGTSSKDISEGDMKRSPYYQMSDRDLATTLVDRLYNNRMIKLADKSDIMVQKCLIMMRYSAYEYFEYNISGIPVAVGRPNKKSEQLFTVYAYVMGSSSPRAISSYKNELIKNFIAEDKKNRRV